MRRAFTVTELLVVIIILAIVTAIAVPSFTGIVDSAEASLAESRLAGALRAARDAAAASSPGADTAAVFFYEPGGRLTIMTYVAVGVMEDVRPAGNIVIRREVFVPAAGAQPVQLPRNWMVRGYAPPFTIDRANTQLAEREGWYAPVGNQERYSGTATGRGDWVFPETGFYDRQRGDDGANRQTFMVRFKGGSGQAVNAPMDTVLVFDPRPSSNRTGVQGLRRADRTADPARFVTEILNATWLRAGTGSAVNVGAIANAAADRRELLGDQSSDTVLARPVSRIALYNEAELAVGLSAAPGANSVRVDRTTGVLYQPGNAPAFVQIGSLSSNQIAERITQWIEGDTNFDNQVDRNPVGNAPGDRPAARIYIMDRYTGEARQLELEI